ncbi:YdeI/OmpD-associated family protein [Fodinicurvata fenggangensis]|uniref:YdeI/OmpD-associated family protein n=1 Tax=Fodinicurvata fenggangensis TaxID=1121830 RepID=UPI0004789442|nr:YdeI/OmpD-associated family protein [Fodinicurvata fenggangensis]
MAEVNSRVGAFFTKAGKWREELKALRTILLDCPVSEEFKWRSPCYTFQDGNVATVWGLKENCALSFFKGVLLKDEEGILVAPGENSRSVRMVKFTSVSEIVEMEAILKDYIHEAIEVEKAGLKVDFPKDDLVFPKELTGKLEQNPDLKTAFEALTPGRQRGYVLHFSQPKQSKTRISRIEKCVPRILEGKGLHDR